MPGYASWKTLYQEEYRQLYEEGYPVGEHPIPDLTAEYLPFPASVRGELREDAVTEAQWEEAYHRLWKVREQGLRSDYPYEEPNELETIFAAARAVPALEPLTEEAYPARLRGAWFGRCAAVALGKPLEMGLSHWEIRDYLEELGAYPLVDWVPARSERRVLREDCLPSTRGNVRFMQPDDDIHYTVLALLLAEKKGMSFTRWDVGENWLNNIPYHWFWCASRQVYWQLVNLTADQPREEQVRRFAEHLNPWRECIDGQIRGDFWGYISPGDPRSGAALAWRECSLSLVKNGLYGGMFVAGCIAAALSRNPTVEQILEGGLSVIPARSRLSEAIQNVRQWYTKENDWFSVADRIVERYDLPFCGTVNNLAMVTLALLHGGLDYDKTITTAVMCGIDTDCNAGTAGSIVGAAVGFDRLDQRWTAPLHDTVKTAVAGFGEGTISQLVERTARVRSRFSS